MLTKDFKRKNHLMHSRASRSEMVEVKHLSLVRHLKGLSISVQHSPFRIHDCSSQLVLMEFLQKNLVEDKSLQTLQL